VSEFLTVRDDHVAVLVQCSSATARRLLVTNNASSELQVGAGRRVATTGDIADSYNDAHLAVRALQRHPSHSGFVAFEDFDFATRLFSNVGLDTMVAWAHEFFQPLEGREPLVTAVHSYFAHGQNIKAAANDLSVHHNSLRYRLAKVEELLGVSFSDPAAISSTYLALTALDLVNDSRSPRIETSRRSADPTVHDVASSDSATDFRRQSPADLGVVRGPDR
jgi:sugar diacid utilization regulator